MVSEIEQLQQRVGKGIDWLREADPSGAFHLWFTAGILPTTPMPAQDDETRQRYAEYFRHRSTWERLSDGLGRLDPKWAPTQPHDIAWKGGTNGRRR